MITRRPFSMSYSPLLIIRSMALALGATWSFTSPAQPPPPAPAPTAAAPAAAAPAKVTGLQVRVLAEFAPGDLGQVKLTGEKDQSSVLFDLPTNHLSNPIAVPARELQLFSPKANRPLAKLVLPEAGSQFIVLFITAKEGGYTPIIIDGNAASFRAGDIYFINHTPQTVLGYVGTATFVLESQAGKILRPSGAREGKFYDVGFGVREKEGDRALSTTRWPVDQHSRSYVFFFVSPKTKRVDFRAVDEFIPPTQP